MNSFFNWNDFVDFYDWEFDIMCKEQKRDIEFYLDRLKVYKGPVLEIGSGTGRITLELLKNNYAVTVVDNAASFLNKLAVNCKDFNNLQIVQADMLEFNTDILFNSIIVSYSTFQYLLTKDLQSLFMNKMHDLLTDNGALLIDISPFTALGQDLPDYYPFYYHYHPKLDADITMFTSYHIDKKELIQYWDDKYLIKYQSGKNEEFNHHLALRRIEISEMKELAEKNKLKVTNIYGSFDKSPINDDADNWLFEIVKND